MGFASPLFKMIGTSNPENVAEAQANIKSGAWTPITYAQGGNTTVIGYRTPGGTTNITMPESIPSTTKDYSPTAKDLRPVPEQYANPSSRGFSASVMREGPQAQPTPPAPPIKSIRATPIPSPAPIRKESTFLENVRGDYETMRSNTRNFLSNVAGFAGTETYSPTLTPLNIGIPFYISTVSRYNQGLKAKELGSIGADIETQRAAGIEPTETVKLYQSKYFDYTNTQNRMFSVDTATGPVKLGMEASAALTTGAYSIIGMPATIGSWAVSTMPEFKSDITNIGKQFMEHPFRSLAVTAVGAGIGWQLMRGGTEVKLESPKTTMTASRQIKVSDDSFITQTYASTKYGGKEFGSEIVSFTKSKGTKDLSKSTSWVYSETKPKVYSSGADIDLITKGYTKYPVEFSQTKMLEKIPGVESYEVTSGFSFGRSAFKSRLSETSTPSYIESNALKISDGKYAVTGTSINPLKTAIIKMESPGSQELALVFRTEGVTKIKGVGMTGEGVSKFKGGMKVIDLTQTLDKSNMVISSGKKSSPGYIADLYKTQKMVSVSTPSSTIGTLSDISKSIASQTPRTASASSVMVTSGVGAIQKGITIQTPKINLIQNVVTPQKISNPTITISKVSQPQFQPTRYSSPQMVDQIPTQTQVQIQRLAQPEISVLRLQQTTPSIPSINIPNISIPTPSGGGSLIIPPLRLFGFDDWLGGKRIVKGKQRKKYTPSFIGIMKGIKGRAPKRITGLEVRPITKGFKWSNLFKK